MPINSKRPLRNQSNTAKYISAAKLKRKLNNNKTDLVTENLILQKKIKQLLSESKLDKAEISELKKKLEELQKQYNRLDEEQNSRSPFSNY
jgi:polyhydroxyalkanoate synthesis regulator phasin